MNIGEAAALSGVTTKTIRYYESIGLIAPAPRTVGGYRSYGDNDVAFLNFIHRARGLGFSVADVNGLLELYHDKNRASADVKALATRHVKSIDTKIAELETIRSTLRHLIEKCHGDDRPACPILDDLAGFG
ncbi:MAG: Cu(I)-responsive transcriptional regulator [Alphaproteobacteria bacterium]|jgi:MerR family copper efflux transcriptional regulator